MSKTIKNENLPSDEPVMMVPEKGDQPISEEMANIKKAIHSFQPSLKYPDDIFSLTAVMEAYEGLISGNFGVGAVLVNKHSGKVLLKAHNSVFTPFFRSDMHAEMILLTEYENLMRGTSGEIYQDVILYTSLEPCPMCLTRILISGISEINFIASDYIAGMVSASDRFPPIWQDLMIGKTIKNANCSPILKELSFNIFNLTGQRLDKKLKKAQ